MALVRRSICWRVAGLTASSEFCILMTDIEGESVNRSQLAIKHVILELGKEHLFLNISSTNIDTLVPSLYQCIKTHRIEVFYLLSQPHPHLCFNLFIFSKTFATKVIFSGPNRWKSLGGKSRL
jgi:hypothetical protein